MYEEILKNKSSYNIVDLVNFYKNKIAKDLENTELLELKSSNYKEYEKFMESKYPYFADRFPFLFDKLIVQPDDLKFLDVMINMLQNTNESNFNEQTQSIADIVAEKNK